MNDNRQRPYYDGKPPKQEKAQPPKPANVVPVDKWTIAAALFVGRDESGKAKPPNE